jgi:hypothetical protein
LYQQRESVLKATDNIEFNLILAFLLDKRQDAVTSLVYAKCTEEQSAKLRGIIQGIDLIVQVREELKKDPIGTGVGEGGY